MVLFAIRWVKWKYLSASGNTLVQHFVEHNLPMPGRHCSRRARRQARDAAPPRLRSSEAIALSPGNGLGRQKISQPYIFFFLGVSQPYI